MALMKSGRFGAGMGPATMMGAYAYLVSVPQLRHADNNEIVNLGDSIFALSGDIYKNLERWSAETWRHYALSGAQMAGGMWGADIPSQYQLAKEDNPDIRVVYMDGGGNDILLPALAFDPYNCAGGNGWWCGDLSQSCRGLVDGIYGETVALLDRMAADGVEQVVCLGYYYLKWGVFGNLTRLSDALDYWNTRLRQACENSCANCVFIDPREAFSGNEGAYILVDGIHPTAKGSEVLARMIRDVIDC